MRAGTLTWSSLTGDRELLYQRHRAVAVVVSVQDPPIWALSKKNPAESRANVGSESVVILLEAHTFKERKRLECLLPLEVPRERSGGTMYDNF